MHTPNYFDAVRPATVPADTYPAILTNSERGVYFGWIRPEDADAESRNIRTWGVRNCYFWDTNEGIGSLAQTGPGPKAKIGAPVTEAILGLKANVFFCEISAVEAFNTAVWYNG